MNITILRFDTIGSTNDEAARQAKLGAPEGLCVVASKQTAGRGRHGRVWVSEKGSGLYFSIILRPAIETRFLPLITLMTGIAVHDTLSELGIKPDIKWVNDILVKGKKISGILAETVDTPTGLAVVVGIGINLTSRNFPPELAATATSIEAEAAHHQEADVEQRLTGLLSYWYETLSGADGPDEILRNWKRRSTYFSRKPVRVTTPAGVCEGVTDGLEENGALRLRTADGTTRVIQAGDVELLRVL